jgi:cytidine deaminase
LPQERDSTPALSPHPEIVIGLVVPVGADTTNLITRLRGKFAEFNYGVSEIHLSRLLGVEFSPGESEFARLKKLMDAGDERSKSFGYRCGLGPLVVDAIQTIREARNESIGLSKPKRTLTPLSRHAYIVHSIKRPEEIDLLRYIYGTAFFVLADQTDVATRLKALAKRIQRTRTAVPEATSKEYAARLIDRDENGYKKHPHGQAVAKAAVKADYFLTHVQEVDRAIDLLFNTRQHAPTMGEYAMYVADATSARSSHPSRQVGTAVVRENNIVATGVNEMAGRYGDVLSDIENDSSDRSKISLAVSIMRQLANDKHLSKALKERYRQQQEENKEEGFELSGSFDEIATKLLAESNLMDITEFQSEVHAEMWALSAAVRLGISIKGSTVYCTTYPCHLCWKHLYAAGIRKLYYILPYDKSRVAQFYPHSQSLIAPFFGVAPRAYRQLFSLSEDKRNEPKRPGSRLVEAHSGSILVDNADRINHISREDNWPDVFASEDAT